jgi:hypothetical protein
VEDLIAFTLSYLFCTTGGTMSENLLYVSGSGCLFCWVITFLTGKVEAENSANLKSSRVVRSRQNCLGLSVVQVTAGQVANCLSQLAKPNHNSKCLD